MRVLLTGSLGSIGRVVEPGLTALGHEVTGVDLAAGAAYEVDCTDPLTVDAVLAEVQPDAVIHLAGIPTESSLPDALASHVRSTAALLEAMVHHDVRRIVYASSNHAVGRTPAAPREAPVPVDARARPDTFYGVAKVAAEALLSLYADRAGIDAVACRIGSFLERPETVRHPSTWLSHDDCVRMVDAALATPAPGFAVLYGISANTRAWWDLDAGHALGYEPLDDAESFVHAIGTGPHDEAEAAHVGGPYATAAFERPALDRSS